MPSEAKTSPPSSFDAIDVAFDERPSLMTLSTEIRFMIYDYIVKGTGTVSVFSQHDIAREVDKSTVHLLHVNRLIRIEVQEFFYKSQTFEFRSAPALNKFVKKIGPYHASIIKKVRLGDWLCRRKLANFINDLTPAFRDSLKGVEHLTIPNPTEHFQVYSSSPDGKVCFDLNKPHFVERFCKPHWLSPGLKTHAILCISEKLASGRLYLKKRGYESCLLFVPKDVKYPQAVEEDNPLWFVVERRNQELAAQYPSVPHHNHQPKTVLARYEQLAVPDRSGMEATLARALAPPEEVDDSSSSESESDSEAHASGAGNPIVLDDKEDDDDDYEDDGDEEDEGRVMPDSNEVEDDS